MHRTTVLVGFARFKLNALAANPAHLACLWKSNHDEIPAVDRIAQTYCHAFVSVASTFRACSARAPTRLFPLDGRCYHLRFLVASP
jgi:hypothetical protein